MIKRRYLFLLLVPLAVISLFTGVGEMNIAGLLAGNIHEW
ncbi:MAG TPA: iron ABC transporter permease, partial [Acinetobacter radioresistens]|nr:iron ABC transporter permease [Acinetobacter radioresistens]